MKYYINCLLTVTCLMFACAKGKVIPAYVGPVIPLEIKTPAVVDKPIQMWIDAHANFSRFAEKANITNYMEKMKASGFTEVVVDVKPGIGYALYNSDILPKLTKWDNVTVNRDWDYLAFWIEEAERLKMSVNASIVVMGYGYTKTRQGLVYDSNTWDGKTQMEMTNSQTPTVLTDIRNQTSADAAMLNPSLPEVQTFVTSIVAEVATKYPKLKGISLDFCRWYGGNYGFGASTIAAFEAYSGKKVNSNNEIITSTGGIGPLYKDWIEFRTSTITNIITGIRSKVKSINPKLELHLWASADWGSRYLVGQNWASKNYVPTSTTRFTPNYSKTGFADQLDVFSLGAYAEAVWVSENPGSVWSIENFVNTYSSYIKGDSKVYGSFASYAFIGKPTAISDAVYLCLKNTDGLMVFEISHVINNNQWGSIKDGIDRVYKK